MKELKELRLDDSHLMLQDNVVRGPILPRGYSELDREIHVKGETVVEGAMYALSLQVTAGPLQVQGAVFIQRELHIFTDCKGDVEFCKSVGSSGSVVCHSTSGKVYFGADINAKSVSLKNAYVAANIFADEVVLENCVVLGGVFAVKSLQLTNVVLGTFHSPSVRIAQELAVLLPSVFSVEPIASLPGSRVRNFALADLGALMRGVPEGERTGYISVDPGKEVQRSVLTDAAGNTQVVLCYSVAGKVLTADLVNMDHLQNHFLLAAGSLGAQTLRTYDLGPDSKGKLLELTPVTIAEFFFKILDGRITVKPLDAKISFAELSRVYGENRA
jgi:hypothetical protein